MEDILQLVLGGKNAILTGAVDFRSRIKIPPGDSEVLEKLQLHGAFKLRAAQFGSPAVEQRLNTLSDRARGISKSEERDQPPLTVASNFIGNFKLINGSTSFSNLVFEVPGAQIRLVGDYNLRNQKVDMKGVFRMDATLSETQSGLKSLLLKPFNPLFRKHGAGFEIPLTVSGTRDHPAVSVFALHHKFTLK
jgi:hypothetical protein